MLTKGETRPFVLVSLDAARRRAELALPAAIGPGPAIGTVGPSEARPG